MVKLTGISLSWSSMTLKLARRSSSESRPRMMKENLIGLRDLRILLPSRIPLTHLALLACLKSLTGLKAQSSLNGLLPSERMVHLSLTTQLSTENMALITGLLVLELRPRSTLMVRSRKVCRPARSTNSELEQRTRLVWVSPVNQLLLTL